ncbi:sigma-54-dependent Fis family transcriptional regulator [Rhizobium lusitanum]|uniref:sigma-54-dependent Fis family transcriptional regulator n=1 Tax=Rhizobium lusitanum TaxID=293958 RepID=UPI00195D6359|nr:sigma-54-dependent Fis family transcriptional regulator [Rhizobium lusitanum]MBM7047266.1 sigma-54-dependent Fis family transcriptional regulator [Rhizobium lusitanum]
MKQDPDTIKNSINALQTRRPMASAGLATIDLGYDERKTMRAWETLLSGDQEHPRSEFLVRSTIHDSWSRCATGGIDALQQEAPFESDRDAVENVARASAELLSAAKRSFSAIGQLLDGTGAMLMLADSDGVLIDAIGDKRTIYDGMDIHLAVGGKWTEDVVGTNGIGTALWTGEPVLVHAAEHFCAGIKSWTCAGAPVRDPFDGRTIGVVDLSGPPNIFRPHNIALVAAAAREIEMALADSQKEERARLLEAFISSANNYRSTDGLMIIDRHGRAIYSNNVPGAQKRRLAEGIRHGTRNCRLPELTDSGFLDSVTTTLPQELRSCHVSPLKLNGDLRGAALLFPMTIERRSSISIVPGTAISQRLRDAASAIVGQSPALLSAVDVATRVAQSEQVTSLLIEGETGVGKELFARLVHLGGQGGTSTTPFVALNCGAITKELFGSELFGHVAGAFTGASREGKPGVFELAHGGVLSLDEIGEMPIDIQPFLLRVLEERVVQRLGDSRSRAVNVRLVASTNRDLKQEVEAGRFRRDLFYRISTVSIRIPPLRERGNDVLLLVEHLNRKIADQKGSAPLRFANEVFDAFLAYSWPGNVRELKNLVERLHVLTDGRTVELPDIPSEISSWSARLDAPSNAAGGPEADVRSFEDAERQAIRNALAAEHGNLTKVAYRLGISRPTLYRKLEQYGIRRGFL